MNPSLHFTDADERTFSQDHAVPLRTVIAYEDVPAGRRAMSTLCRLLASAGEPVHLFPALWRFDVLADPDWKEEARRDVRMAELFLLATSLTSAVPPAVEQFVGEFLGEARSTGAMLVALFGPEERWTIELQPRPGAADQTIRVALEPQAGGLLTIKRKGQASVRT